MRIGLIRMRHTPYGGAETFLGRFIAELIGRGHSVDVFSTRWEGGAGVNVHEISTFGPSFLKPLVFAFKAASAVESAAPDVVVSLERTSCQDIYRAGDGCHREWLIRRAADSSWLKRVLIRLNPLHLVILYLEGRLFRSPALKKVAANSVAVKRDIMRHYGLPEEKICVIYNGIDSGAFARSPETRERIRASLGVTKDTVVLLFVGSGFERKGLKYLIRALPSLKDRGDVRLVVVGKGDPARYIKEAGRLGVSDRVVFKGPVKDALSYYQAGDIFVLPSIYEPFSNACLEAMAAGLPVVTTRVNGASEVLTDGVNAGIVDDPADHIGLSGKIARFLDAGRRAEAGKLARETALKYPIEKNVGEFLNLIESIRK